MRKLINEIENLRGSVVSVFGQPHEIETIAEDELIIDTVELLKSLEEYAIDTIEVEEGCVYCMGDGTVMEEQPCDMCNGTGYEQGQCDSCNGEGCDECDDGIVEEICNYCNGEGIEEYEETCDECDGEGTITVEEDALKAIDILENCWEIEEVEHNNSYNWNAPLSNHIDYTVYEDKEGTHSDYIVLCIHRYGDVRCNYTNDIVLEMSYQKFVEKLGECNKQVEFENDGTLFTAEISATGDNVRVTDEFNMFDEDFYAYDMDELKKEVREYLE